MKIENPQQYIGEKYGHTTIIGYYGKYVDGRYEFICKCDCGKEFHAIMREKGKIKNSCDRCRNKRFVRYLFNYNGEDLSISQISERFNITENILRRRLLDKKMSVEEAINYQRPKPKDRNEWRKNNLDRLRENTKKWLQKNKDYPKNYYLLKKEEIKRNARERYTNRKKGESK